MKLLQAQHNRQHPKRKAKALEAAKILKQITGILVRDLTRKLLLAGKLDAYTSDLEKYNEVLKQERPSKNKRYSLHEDTIFCIAKGKASVRYEFGSKFGLLWNRSRGIIVSGAYCGNEYDGHSLNKLLSNHDSINVSKLDAIYCDRGYRGAKLEGIEVHIPGNPKKKDSAYMRSKKRNHFRLRAGIEPIIGHLKQDFRMGLNYLKGKIGDVVNGIMACAAFNFQKWMNLKNP